MRKYCEVCHTEIISFTDLTQVIVTREHLAVPNSVKIASMRVVRQTDEISKLSRFYFMYTCFRIMRPAKTANTIFTTYLSKVQSQPRESPLGSELYRIILKDLYHAEAPF